MFWIVREGVTPEMPEFSCHSIHQFLISDHTRVIVSADRRRITTKTSAVQNGVQWTEAGKPQEDILTKVWDSRKHDTGV